MNRVPTDAEILADLARVKAVFQLRAIEAHIRGPSVIQGQSTGDVG